MYWHENQKKKDIIVFIAIQEKNDDKRAERVICSFTAKNCHYLVRKSISSLSVLSEYNCAYTPQVLIWRGINNPFEITFCHLRINVYIILIDLKHLFLQIIYYANCLFYERLRASLHASQIAVNFNNNNLYIFLFKRLYLLLLLYTDKLLRKFLNSQEKTT